MVFDPSQEEQGLCTGEAFGSNEHLSRLVCWSVFVNLTQPRDTWGEGTLVEELPPSDGSVCGGIFLIANLWKRAQLTMGGVTPVCVVLDQIRKVTEKKPGNKPVRRDLLWLLL